jgi:NADH-ubiquinone oxidoreductase chain 2
VYKDKKHNDNLIDKNNSPIQLINQIKGYYYINPVLALSLATTLFSFVGVPPLIGFFAKQMVLSAALDDGYVFMALVAILTSVISAVYYLSVIKQIFFFKPDYERNPALYNVILKGKITNATNISKDVEFKSENIILSSSLSTCISILTLILLLFMYIPGE